MPKTQVSITALVTAFSRAYHSMNDSPKIFDDFLAPQMFTAEDHAYFNLNLAKSLEFFDPEFAATGPDQPTALARVMQIQNCPITLSRSRYTEDSLEAAVKQEARQYVILGAGLDTFAFRRPDLLKNLQIFEIDHPATQNDKRRRISELGWEIPVELHFVPIDFSKDNLAAALKNSAYDPSLRSFFSWLGVTYYLTREIIFDTLRAIAGITPAGSIVVFDYMDMDALIPEKVAKRTQLMQEVVRRAGEPMKTGFDPPALAVELAALRLQLEEDLSPVEIEDRYFKGRSDDYHVSEHIHFARVVVG